MTAVTANPSLGVPPDNSKSDPVVVGLLMRIIVLCLLSIRFVIILFCCSRYIERTRQVFVRNNK